ncbi:MAG TPA: 3-phosphoshikimate 1-carboxyvinyltransferase, partial [Rhodanobacteraceae bacterium]|nr:3-phosphoshikimate 1-carboxyvinyltransferase [Rhodanobacteraceae bacterium]
LRALGIRVDETPDGAIIEGGVLSGGRVDSHGDHRVAMSFTVAGLVAADAVVVSDCANVATSFPGFIELANAAGFAVVGDLR